MPRRTAGAFVTREDAIAAVGRLVAWIDAAQAHSMPWCPDHQKGRCASCAEKVALYQQARQDAAALFLEKPL